MSKSERSGANQYGSRDEWEQIGKGGFGVVYKAIDKCGQFVAIKQIPKSRVGVDAKDEIRAMQKLANVKNNVWIVKYIADWEDDENTYIVMEYCKEGTLREHIKRKGRLRNETAANVLSQIVGGLEMMHKHQLMHRDLTASNVLITRKEGELLHVKLADFGLAKDVPKKAALATIVGTPGYMAPQIRGKEKYDKEADVFSLGGILYAMVVGSDPPKTPSFDTAGYPIFEESKVGMLDETVRDLLRRMMCNYVEKRIRLEEIDQHPFMESTYKKRLQVIMGLGKSLSTTKIDDTPLPYLPRTVLAGSKIRRSANLSSALESDKLRAKPAAANGRRPRLQQPPAPPPAPQSTTIQPRGDMSKVLLWPFPTVPFAYIRTNKLGRFALLNAKDSPQGVVQPSIVYEMADENGNVRRIFEIYYNWRPSCQRLLVFHPKDCQKIPEKSNRMLEKDMESQIKIRSKEELLAADNEIRLGYKRMCQFIPLAESRISQGTFYNAFGHTGYTVELKYNGAVEITTPEGKKAVKKPSDVRPNGDPLNDRELGILHAGMAKLCEVVDMKAHQDMIPKGSKMEGKGIPPPKMRPFVISC